MQSQPWTLLKRSCPILIQVSELMELPSQSILLVLLNRLGLFFCSKNRNNWKEKQRFNLVSFNSKNQYVAGTGWWKLTSSILNSALDWIKSLNAQGLHQHVGCRFDSPCRTWTPKPSIYSRTVGPDQDPKQILSQVHLKHQSCPFTPSSFKLQRFGRPTSFWTSWAAGRPKGTLPLFQRETAGDARSRRDRYLMRVSAVWQRAITGCPRYRRKTHVWFLQSEDTAILKARDREGSSNTSLRLPSWERECSRLSISGKYKELNKSPG